MSYDDLFNSWVRHESGRVCDTAARPVPSHHQLSDEQLAAVCEHAAVDPILAITLTWRMICPDWDRAGKKSIRPGDHTLPRAQWEAIAAALTKYRGDPLSGANAVMDWINVGPGVEEES